MKLVVLTNDDSRFGLTILNEMKARGIRVEAVVAIRQSLRYDRMLFRFVKRRVGSAQALYFGVRRVLHGLRSRWVDRWRRPDFVTDFEALAEAVYRTRGTNTAQTREILEKLEPDVVVIGQTGILRRQLIEIPRLGILNGHPGILPDYRGIDSFMWAIQNDEPEKVGCTVHWVDTGVDTGPILRRERLPLVDEGLMQLDERLFDFASALLAEVVSEIDVEQSPSGEPQDPKAGVQYYKMTLGQERAVRRKLRALA
jgi:methionyl-tRNA formyltransferase